VTKSPVCPGESQEDQGITTVEPLVYQLGADIFGLLVPVALQKSGDCLFLIYFEVMVVMERGMYP